MKSIKDYIIVSPEGVTYKAQIIKGYIALYVCNDFWILAKGYKLYKYRPSDEKIQYFSKINDPANELVAYNKFSRRLFRAEITHLYNFSGNWFCIARKGIFKYDSKSNLFELCCRINRGSRPMNLCQDSDGTIYYGEYFFNPNREEVKIFKSPDNGKSWEIAYKFKAGEINHIHGIFKDKYTGYLWVFTGDDDKACIAGYTTDGFKTFIREFEGRQEYRVCVPLFKKESIIYPTDSQYVVNTIRQIGRGNKDIKDLTTIQGSGIYAVDTGNFYLVSTTVEPSKLNIDNNSYLWYSSDGEKWIELLSFKKDCFNRNLFQFGSIRFPNYAQPCDYIVITGRALKGLDQSTLIIPTTLISE